MSNEDYASSKRTPHTEDDKAAKKSRVEDTDDDNDDVGEEPLKDDESMISNESFTTCIKFLLTKMWFIATPITRKSGIVLKNKLAADVNALAAGHEPIGVGAWYVMRAYRLYLEWLAKDMSEETMCKLSASLHWSGGWLKSVGQSACALDERFGSDTSILKSYGISKDTNKTDFQKFQKIGSCPYDKLESTVDECLNLENIVNDLETVLQRHSSFAEILNPMDLIYLSFVRFTIEYFRPSLSEVQLLVENLWKNDSETKRGLFFF